MEEQGAIPFPSTVLCSLSPCVSCKAVANYMDLAQLECDTALEAAMKSDDEDLDWLY